MIHSVQISGYRGFDHFQMSGLGRVNLLVGKNNCGKTSVLEALHVLSSEGDIEALWQLCGRRGERFSDETSARRYGPDDEIDISHLFLGHELSVGNKFTITARNEIAARFISFEVAQAGNKDRVPKGEILDSSETAPLRLVVRITSSFRPRLSIPLSRKGGVSQRNFDWPRRALDRPEKENVTSSNLISTDSLTGSELARMWDKVQLTPQEALVLKALQFIDPKIEQIRATGRVPQFGDRGGFIVKRSDYKQPIPLGSLGDGARRMLAMAIVMTQSRDGVLLIDEIDTGLHYTVMADMWKLIYNAAKELSVQVFATTHSYDCVHALASICREVEASDSDVTIQRIETGKIKAIQFSEAEILMTAERNIEVR